jgi:DNA-binding IclR family transcriptional regulator
MEQTVAKAFRLLEALAAHPQPQRVSELGRELGIAKSNVHRLLRTLIALGYVRQDDQGLYVASLRLWERGTRVLAHLPVRHLAHDHLMRLAAGTGEQVNLAILDGNEMLYVATVEAAHANSSRSMLGQRIVGTRIPLHAAATGKVILAYQPEATIRALAKHLQPLTRRTIGTLERLRAELAEVRRRGFATNLAEWRADVHAVAAPITAPDGRGIAALSIAGPADRLQARLLRTLAPQVVETAGAISLDLAYAARGGMPRPEADGRRARTADDGPANQPLREA